MNIDTRKIDEFREITQPVVEWLKANAHPNSAVVIETTSAVLYEGVTAYTTSGSYDGRNDRP